jgi:hypothetical protein
MTSDLAPFNGLLNYFTASYEKENMKQIFLRNIAYGDTIWTEPIVRYFLGQGEEVSIQVNRTEVFDNYPNPNLFVNDISKMIPLQKDFISLQFELFPKIHILEAYARQAHITLPLNYPQLHLSEEEKKRRIPMRYAILNLDAYNSPINLSRNAYGIRWEEVTHYLHSQGIEVIQLSKNGENLVADWIATVSIRDVMSWIYNAALFIGLDSGPSHIASALGIPSIIFFGSVNPMLRHLDRNKKVFIQQGCPFAHCYHTPDPAPRRFGQICRMVKVGNPPPCCIHDTKTVINAIQSLFA